MLVAHDDPGFRAHARFNRAGERRNVVGEDGVPICFEPVEELPITQQAIFGDLGISRFHLAQRPGRQSFRIGQHEAGLMEGADQVFAVRGIDARLAANRAIDLGQKRCRDLYETHAAAQNTGRKATRSILTGPVSTRAC